MQNTTSLSVAFADSIHDEANRMLQKALDLDFQQGYVHFIRGKILLAQGRPQEALVEMQQTS